MGKPERYDLSLEFTLDGKVSDQAEEKFGIREITSEVHAANRRLFSINGKNILIRGGGWTPDMMLREDPQRLRDDFRYVQDMGLNTIRLEGKLEPESSSIWPTSAEFCVIAGWCCCDHWEHWANWKAQDFTIAATIVARPDLPPAQPSQPHRVAERQRQSAARPTWNKPTSKLRKNCCGRIRSCLPQPQSLPASPVRAA